MHSSIVLTHPTPRMSTLNRRAVKVGMPYLHEKWINSTPVLPPEILANKILSGARYNHPQKLRSCLTELRQTDSK